MYSTELKYRWAYFIFGRLDGLSRGLDPDRLIPVCVRKEAVLSSQIEGTQSTFTELLEYENAEAPGMPVDDIRQVSRYVSALRYGVDQIKVIRSACGSSVTRTAS